jgi:hypothetical protein
MIRRSPGTLHDHTARLDPVQSPLLCKRTILHQALLLRAPRLVVLLLMFLCIRMIQDSSTIFGNQTNVLMVRSPILWYDHPLLSPHLMLLL